MLQRYPSSLIALSFRGVYMSLLMVANISDDENETIVKYTCPSILYILRELTKKETYIGRVVE